MNKPSWDDAPEWAKYLAMNDSCEWFWFEVKPQFYIDGVWRSHSIRFKKALLEADGSETLEKRP